MEPKRYEPTMTWVIAHHPWEQPENGWAYKCDKGDVLQFATKQEAEDAMTQDDKDYGSVALHIDANSIHF